MTKTELRKIYLAKQRSLKPEIRAEYSKRISGHFFSNFDLGEISVAHCFIPIEKFNEVDSTLIFRRIWSEFPHTTTAVPRVDFESGEMQSLRFTLETALVKSNWGIQEPLHGGFVETAEVDMVLVPLLTFNEAGHRVGYGKGFYDRFLSKCREDCVKIGLSYFPPIAEISDVNETDIRLDFCITPDGIKSQHREQ